MGVSDIDLIDIASKEVGYYEGMGDNTKYGAWIGINNAAWCHSFASWCAAQCSCSEVPKTASTTTGMQHFINKGKFGYKGHYTPKRNDLVYFKTDYSHVGIVEYIDGDMLHTIEGNTSNKVARRIWNLNNEHITGYGIVDQFVGSSSGTTMGSNPDKKKEKDVSEELKYLQNVLKLNETAKTKIPTKVKNYEIVKKNVCNKCDVFISIYNGKTKFSVSVLEGMQVTWERKGSPGKLTFDTVKSNKYIIKEGNLVTVRVNDTKFFRGRVFTVKETKDSKLSITVYDQLRYLKNKESFSYTKKTADYIIRCIAKKFRLNIGTLANTKYPVSRVEDGVTMFDVINNAILETVTCTGKMYILYDDFGKLMLKQPSQMVVNSSLIDAKTAEDYSYTRSIDSNTYNSVKLIYTDEETHKRIECVKESQTNITKWGKLQYYDTIHSPKIGKMKAKLLLNEYNRVSRQLSISGCIGNLKVRAGSLVPILLTLNDQKISRYMLVYKVIHKFDSGHHTMDLYVTGGDFSGE